MKRAAAQEAYCLHRRAYRETSFLVDIFTKEEGRFTVIARGARNIKSSMQGLLQPFTPLFISWAGSGELVTLTQVELRADVKRLQGDALYAGMYLNELLIRLMHPHDSHPDLFLTYQETLHTLSTQGLQARFLRQFEKRLLEALGYGLLPVGDRRTKETIHSENYYRFVPDQGFVLSQTAGELNVFSGKNLQAMADECWDDESTLQEAKRLMRLVLSQLLGGKPIYSRKLFF